MTDPRLVEYVKKGVKQGFNVAYIKDILLKHGYNTDEVNAAVSAAISRPAIKSKGRVLAIAGAVVFGVLFLFLLFPLERNNITGYSSAETEDLSLQEYLNQIGELSEKIDKQETTIEEQLELIKGLKFTAEDKNEIIEEIEQLYKDIKKERESIKETLVELLRAIITRSNVGTTEN